MFYAHDHMYIYMSYTLAIRGLLPTSYLQLGCPIRSRRLLRQDDSVPWRTTSQEAWDPAGCGEGKSSLRGIYRDPISMRSY